MAADSAFTARADRKFGREIYHRQHLYIILRPIKLQKVHVKFPRNTPPFVKSRDLKRFQSESFRINSEFFLRNIEKHK